eukprot:778752-Pelagomonas_calceolata.AAC.1
MSFTNTRMHTCLREPSHLLIINTIIIICRVLGLMMSGLLENPGRVHHAHVVARTGLLIIEHSLGQVSLRIELQHDGLEAKVTEAIAQLQRARALGHASLGEPAAHHLWGAYTYKRTCSSGLDWIMRFWNSSGF